MKRTKVWGQKEITAVSRNARDTGLWEQHIEARLRGLRYLVDGLCDAADLDWPGQGIRNREALEELLIKEAAVRWIVQVAKHCNGSIREAMWSDIETSVAHLEKTAESVIRTEIN